MKYLILCFLIVSCASSSKISGEHQKERGLSDQDMALIKPHVQKYGGQMATVNAGTNAFDKSSMTNFKDRMRRLFCNCYERSGEACLSTPEGLEGRDKRLWAKSNAAEIIIKLNQNNIMFSDSALGQGYALDPDEC